MNLSTEHGRRGIFCHTGSMGEEALFMTNRGRVLGGIAALALICTQAGSVFAQPRAASPHDLITKISKLFHWAQPRLEARSADGKQFSLAIFQRGKPVSL